MDLQILKAETVTGQCGQAIDVYLSGGRAIRIWDGDAYLIEAIPGDVLDERVPVQSVPVFEG